MDGHYRLVTLDAATPGMVLSDDVLDMQGHVLLAKGAVLNETILASLRRHHVTLVAIVPEDAVENDRETEISAHEARLKQLFRKKDVNGDDATELLEQLVRQFRMGDPA